MKIAVLVSGGVDSSAALSLLVDQGHDVTAFYLKIWLEDELDHLGNCPWQEDLTFVELLCTQLDVPLKVIPLQQAYHDRVVSYTLAEIKSGRTPNPDIFCNQMVKFGAFFDAIDDNFEKVASGHYAQVSIENGRAVLRQGADPVKDQTYFLSRLSQDQLKRALFPIGHLSKSAVRALAEKAGLSAANRPDSQGICFLGKIPYNEFIGHHLGKKEGDLVELETGDVIGKHNGFWFHTIGQRRGLGLSGGPWFVADKDADKNIVFISRNYFSSDKKRQTFKIENYHAISGDLIAGTTYAVKLRHGPHSHNCTILSIENDTAVVKLADRDQGIAPGQYAVFYDGQVCVGSGMMAECLDDGHVAT